MLRSLYCTGMLYPAKSTIFPPCDTWKSCNAVFFVDACCTCSDNTPCELNNQSINQSINHAAGDAPRYLTSLLTLASEVTGRQHGLMEFAGVDKAARSKTGVWKMREWTHWHDVARVDIAGVDNAAPFWQGWTMQDCLEWSAVTKALYKITILANDSLYI